WGGGYGGGGFGARRVPARRSPCYRPSGSYTIPPSPPFSSIPLLRVQQWGEGMGVAGVSSQPPTTSSSLSLPRLLLCREKGGRLEVKGVAGRDLQHQPPRPPFSSFPLLWVQQWGGRGSAAPTPPPPLLLHPPAAGAAVGGGGDLQHQLPRPPFSSIPLLQVQQWGGGYGGGRCE
ncbi:unnamed protein product, partial [Closterium sp. NIES-54]